MAHQILEKSIFLHAIEIAAPAERAAYLDQACRENPNLRAELESLLAAHDRLGSESSPLESTAAFSPLAELPGTMIGPFKLIEPIGEGGMGTVWMAQQTEPVKRIVALKLIKAGMDTKQVLARFEAERQALALMEHPNIAKVLDAGSTADSSSANSAPPRATEEQSHAEAERSQRIRAYGAGRPYFVMELVKGQPITKYCDEHHLTPRQRLELFVPVCHAIQHAHQKGIIHRDLKPSNVLVAQYDGRPVPKVIDFGVAKAAGQPLTEHTLVTGFGAIIGTLEYMSPEQAEINQLDIDTRSDIYSLGVLLYELLTGSTPFSKKDLEKAGMLEMLRLIREQEPSKPSTKLSTAEGLPTLAANRGTEPAKLTKLVRGELDWIVMKALEKDRNRRYETANGFAMDVQRYLADEAVQACPPSAGYRLRKFARRNRRVMAAVAAAGIVVALGIVGLVINNILVKREKERVVREKERGDRHLARAKKVVEEYLANTAEDRRLKAAGLFELRKALLLSMVAFVEQLAADEGDDKTSRVDRAWAHTRLAKIFGEVAENDTAIVHYDRARAIWAGLAADFPTEAGARVELAECDNDRGAILSDMRRTDDAERWLRRALEAREQLAREDPTVAAHHRNVAATLNNLATVELYRGNREGWKKLLEQAIVHQQTAVTADPHNQTARRFLANHHHNLGMCLMDLKQFVDAAKAHESARSLFAALAAEYPDAAEYRAGVAGSHHQLGKWHLRHGNAAKAAAEFRRAAIELEPVTVEMPAVPDYRRHLAQIYHDLGSLLYINGQEKESKDPLDRGLKLREQLYREYPKWVDVAAEFGVSLIKRGADEADAGQFEAAMPPLTRAVQVLEPLTGRDPPLPGADRLLRNACGARADVLMRLGRPAEALIDYDKVLALRAVENREYFRIQRALALAQTKNHARATVEASEVADTPDLPAFLLLDAAGVHAICSAAVRDNAKLSEQYAAKAVEILRQAFEKNYKSIATDVQSDKKLHALRKRADFEKLLKEWEDKQDK